MLKDEGWKLELRLTLMLETQKFIHYVIADAVRHNRHALAGKGRPLGLHQMNRFRSVLHILYDS